MKEKVQQIMTKVCEFIEFLIAGIVILYLFLRDHTCQLLKIYLFKLEIQRNS